MRKMKIVELVVMDLTSARHEMLSPHYRENYPETFDPQTKEEYLYCGPFRMTDELPNSNLSVGQALLSPTRTYLPVVQSIMAEKGESIQGLVHCSGGGQTKCMRFGTGVHHIKDNLFTPPPLFRKSKKFLGRLMRKCTKFITWVIGLRYTASPMQLKKLFQFPNHFISRHKLLEERKAVPKKTRVITSQLKLTRSS